MAWIRWLGVTAMGMSSVLALPAWSQQNAQGGPAAHVLEEVMVTARRREETLQSVPIAISAFSQQELEQLRIFQLNDLQKFTPSLRQFFGAMNRNGDQLQLRSLPGVLTYFAEARAPSLGPGRFYDMANVQVLKGPQGTLFGGTSTGGAILFQPQRPEEELSGYVSASLGNYDYRELEGAVNIPLVSDTLLARVAFNHRQRDGFTKDVGPFFPGRDYDDVDNTGIRLGVTWKPGGSFENYTVLNGYRRDTHGTGIKAIDFNPAGPAFFVFGQAFADAIAFQQQIGPRRTALSTDQRNKAKEIGLVNISDWQLNEQITLRNIASYRRDKVLNRAEFEGTILPILDNVGTDWTGTERLWTEELQLQGMSFQDSLEWTIGAYLEDSKPVGHPRSEQVTFGAPPATNASVNESEQRAIYAQGSLDAGHYFGQLEGLNVTLGVRKSWDEQTSIRNQYAANGACSGLPGMMFPDCEIVLTGKNDEVTWTAGLEYQLNDDHFLYLTVRKGYRPGSFNFFAPRADLARVEPEFVEDVEIGMKSEWSVGEGNLRTNIAYYLADYTDIQRAVGFYDPETNLQGSLTQNAAKAQAQGLEVEARLAFGNLDFTASYAWSDAEYEEFISQTPQGPIDLSGVPFPSSPEHKYSLQARYTHALADGLGDVIAVITWSWQDKYWGLAPDVQPYAEQPSYGLLDINLAWESVAGSNFDLTLFGTNVNDKTYLASAGGVWDVLGYVPAIYGEPRMYGLKLTYRFD